MTESLFGFSLHLDHVEALQEFRDSHVADRTVPIFR